MQRAFDLFRLFQLEERPSEDVHIAMILFLYVLDVLRSNIERNNKGMPGFVRLTMFAEFVGKIPGTEVFELPDKATVRENHFTGSLEG